MPGRINCEGVNTVLYYLGCRIPRGSDCEDGWKCREGVYCSALEVCSVTEKEFERGFVLSFHYHDKIKGCVHFDTPEQAAEFLEKIKSDVF